MDSLSLKRLWVLMVTAFVDMVGFALVLPLLPLYAKDFGAEASTIGLILAAFALAQLLTAPLWGRLSDRVGRRPVIIGGQALAAVAFVLFGLADAAHATYGSAAGMVVLLLSRFAQGAGGGTISANQAYVSDAIRSEDRAQALGWITAATSAGVMLGPAIGSLSLSFTGERAAPGLIAAGFCLLNIVFAWTWLPESAPRATEGSTNDEETTNKTANGTTKPARSLRRSLYEVLAKPAQPAHTLIWVYASGMLAFMASSSIISLYLSDQFGVDERSIGWFYTVIGFVSVIMRGLILGVLVRRFGEVRVLRLGILVLATGLVLGPFVRGSWTAPIPGEWAFLLVMLFIPTGTALLFPSVTSLISRYAERGEVGQIHGVQQAFGGTSRMLAPVLAGVSYELCPPATGSLCGGALPFWLAAVVLLLTGLVSLRIAPGGEKASDDRSHPGKVGENPELTE